MASQQRLTQRHIQLRGISSMALLGAIGSQIVSIFFGIARGIGFLAVRIEDIPGETLSCLFSFQSFYFDQIIYLALGAFAGILYQRIFHSLDQAGPKTGALLGLVQYLVSGIALALVSPVIPTTIQVLPSQSPFSSGMAVLTFAWIILLHVFFGWFLGIFAMKNFFQEQLALPSEMNRKHDAASDERLAS